MAYRKAVKQTRTIDRLAVLSVLTLLAGGLIVARLFLLQVLNHGFYVALAEDRDLNAEKLQPTRGEIFFRDGSSTDDLLPLATNREVRLVYAVPKRVSDPEQAADKLSELLSVDRDALLARLRKPNDLYEPVQHDVPNELAAKVEALRLDGIATAPEMTRYYPFADIMSQVTGFLGYKEEARVGQYGIEGYWEQALAGTPGALETSRENGIAGMLQRSTIREARDGENIVLTIDRTVQFAVCKRLAAAVEKHSAEGGSVVVVQPATGAIIALCNVPTFDANHYTDTNDLNVFSNAAVSAQYEPGSVMKAVTLAAGVDAGLIEPMTTYEDTGSVQIGKYTIRNSENKTYGVQTMAQVLEESINTGAVFVVRKLGNERFREYLQRFGFGEPTGIALQGEAAGNIAPLEQKGDIYAATASFGQGVSVTPLQMAMAYAALVNDGKLMKPYIVDEVIKPNGFREKTQPDVVRRVVTAQTAQTMRAMLINVVRKGHGKRASVPGFYIGGKTGTAQIPYPDRAGYDPNQHIGTFVGFGSLAEPKFVMIIKMINPHDVQFAESSAAPLFGDIAEFLTQYYRMTPDDQDHAGQ